MIVEVSVPFLWSHEELKQYHLLVDVRSLIVIEVAWDFITFSFVSHVFVGLVSSYS